MTPRASLFRKQIFLYLRRCNSSRASSPWWWPGFLCTPASWSWSWPVLCGSWWPPGTRDEHIINSNKWLSRTVKTDQGKENYYSPISTWDSMGLGWPVLISPLLPSYWDNSGKSERISNASKLTSNDEWDWEWEDSTLT